MAIAPAFIHPRGSYINPLYQTKHSRAYLPSTTPRTVKNSKCLNPTSTAIPATSNITNSNKNVWNDSTMVDEKSEILAWPSPLEPQIRHHDIQTRRIDEVGYWLILTEEYRHWFGGIRGGNSDGSALFCYGGPGVGKTFIR